MRIALIILGLVLVAGCGDGGSGATDGPRPVPTGVVPPEAQSGTPGSEFSTPIPKESVDALPECSEVWVEGETLPKDYNACKLPGGGIDRGNTYACTDGNGALIGYNDQLFARLGGVIRAYGEDDLAFSQELFEVCKPG